MRQRFKIVLISTFVFLAKGFFVVTELLTKASTNNALTDESLDKIESDDSKEETTEIEESFIQQMEHSIDNKKMNKRSGNIRRFLRENFIQVLGCLCLGFIIALAVYRLLME